MRALYDIVFFFFSILYLPLFLLKGKWTRSSLSRFGIIPDEIVMRLREKPVLWVHAVSVGETGLAVAFLNKIRQEMPGTQFLITTTTLAGQEVAKKIKNEEDVVLFFPVDFRFAVKKFIEKTSPAAVVLLETEIWPNLIYELSAKKIPVMILNGRISDKAVKKYRPVRVFLKKVLNRLSVIGVQDEQMRTRFIELGADPERVTRTGNLKFDWVPAPSLSRDTSALRNFCRRPSEFLWVAGSTHDGEEEILLEVYKRLKSEKGNLRLLLAPRHLGRTGDIEKLAVKKNLKIKKISNETVHDAAGADEVWLLNQMGVLAALYEICDAAFVGGSLSGSGGHNLVEPAYYEKAILFGPGMHNFSEMAKEFKDNQAALEVSDEGQLYLSLKSLVEDAGRRVRLGKAARRVVLRHQGATEKSRELLTNYWPRFKERKLVTV